tara:strand:+ start:5317 stop:5748 length:432 start_codon:yes stop_codon:yes gene_type:complete
MLLKWLRASAILTFLTEKRLPADSASMLVPSDIDQPQEMTLPSITIYRPVGGRGYPLKAVHLVFGDLFVGDGACLEGYFSQTTGTAARILIMPRRTQHYTASPIRRGVLQQWNFFQHVTEASHRGRYHHEHTMSVDVTRDNSS